MKKALLHMFFFFGMLTGSMAQKPTTGDAAFDAKLNGLLTFSVTPISVTELQNKMDKVQLFDAREEAEFNVSHMPGAEHIGFDSFDPSNIDNVKKDTPIVLYCSIGYRSEKIGERLKAMGYTNVFNLYGSLFDWANKGLPMIDSTGKETATIHTYNEEWSQWIKNPVIKKVW